MLEGHLVRLEVVTCHDENKIVGLRDSVLCIYDLELLSALRADKQTVVFWMLGAGCREVILVGFIFWLAVVDTVFAIIATNTTAQHCEIEAVEEVGPRDILFVWKA